MREFNKDHCKKEIEEIIVFSLKTLPWPTLPSQSPCP